MGLDIRFREESHVYCPHCGKCTGHKIEAEYGSGGRGWYPFLESIGYYVPFDQRTEENDWYGKDMVLTDEQVMEAYVFAKNNSGLYDACEIKNMLADAMVSKNRIVVNADW